MLPVEHLNRPVKLWRSWINPKGNSLNVIAHKMFRGEMALHIKQQNTILKVRFESENIMMWTYFEVYCTTKLV